MRFAVIAEIPETFATIQYCATATEAVELAGTMKGDRFTVRIADGQGKVYQRAEFQQLLADYAA